MTTGSLRLVREGSNRGGDEGPSRMSVTLHSAISGRPLRRVVDDRGPGIDTVLVAASPRVAYLLVESQGMEWRLTLEEGVAAAGAEQSR